MVGKNTFYKACSEQGSALIQTTFAIFFMLILFFAIANFGMLQYSTSTLQAHIQGAVSRMSYDTIIASDNPACALKEGILAQAGAIVPCNLHVSNVCIDSLPHDTLAQSVRDDTNNLLLSMHRDDTNIQADIFYDVPVLANISIMPAYTLVYHLEANKVTFSQVEILTS